MGLELSPDAEADYVLDSAFRENLLLACGLEPVWRRFTPTPPSALAIRIEEHFVGARCVDVVTISAALRETL